MKPPITVSVGQRFGRLVVMGEAPSRNGQRVKVRCDCSATKEVYLYNIQSKRTVSCGCHRVAKACASLTKHGMNRTPEYVAWGQMLRRCYARNLRCWGNYGGRGIKVCDEWRADFAAFFSHVGPRPSSAHSLDRINNDGDYEPGNVRWATRAQQSRNRRASRFIEFNGERLTLGEWAKRIGIDQAGLAWRLKRWDFNKAMTAPRSWP